jgi:choline dehydrogenase-like flavoprotein
MAASELARAGLRVCALEEGPWLELSDMSQREDDMLPKLYQERGARATADRAIRVLAGRCVGGSTVHNMNLCKRTPRQILEHWTRDFGVSGCSAAALEPVFASVERDLGVSEIPRDWRNRNNQVLERGVQALGWRGGPLSHNRVGCQQSGFCELGCPFNAKQNALKVLIPDALGHGATVVSDARVDRIVHSSGRVRGVVGVLLDANGRAHAELRVSARAVVMAASAVGSSTLAIRSGLPDPHDRLGRGLHLHPGGGVIGWFGERIEGDRGIPQSYECTELLDLAPGSDRRVWITTAFAHPIGAAVMLPGFGPEHREWLSRYSELGVLTAMVHDETAGRIRVASDGRPSIDYVMGDSDRRQLGRGLRACAELLLAAGAREVMIPSAPSISIRSKRDLDRVGNDVPRGLPLAAVHPLGGLCLGDDPRRAAMTSRGEHHHVRGLFALDGSLFPTSIGVPPQISIYSFARHLSRHVVESVRG